MFKRGLLNTTPEISIYFVIVILISEEIKGKSNMYFSFLSLYLENGCHEVIYFAPVGGKAVWTRRWSAKWHDIFLSYSIINAIRSYNWPVWVSFIITLPVVRSKDMVIFENQCCSPLDHGSYTTRLWKTLDKAFI